MPCIIKGREIFGIQRLLSVFWVETSLLEGRVMILELLP